MTCLAILPFRSQYRWFPVDKAAWVSPVGFDELSVGGISFSSSMSWPPNRSYCLEIVLTPSQSLPLLHFISLFLHYTHGPLTHSFVSSSFHSFQRLAWHSQGVSPVPWLLQTVINSLPSPNIGKLQHETRRVFAHEWAWEVVVSLTEFPPGLLLITSVSF